MDANVSYPLYLIFFHFSLFWWPSAGFLTALFSSCFLAFSLIGWLIFITMLLLTHVFLLQVVVYLNSDDRPFQHSPSSDHPEAYTTILDSIRTGACYGIDAEDGGSGTISQAEGLTFLYHFLICWPPPMFFFRKLLHRQCRDLSESAVSNDRDRCGWCSTSGRGINKRLCLCRGSHPLSLFLFYPSWVLTPIFIVSSISGHKPRGLSFSFSLFSFSLSSSFSHHPLLPHAPFLRMNPLFPWAIVKPRLLWSPPQKRWHTKNSTRHS